MDTKDAVARVNDRAISAATFESTLGRLGNQPGKDFNSLDGRKELLREMVDEELLFQAAQQEGFVESSDRVRREIAREYLAERIGKERYEPTDEEIRKLFESMRGELEKVRASHILFKPEKPGDEGSEQKARKKAEALLARIRNEGPGADFAKLARQHSEDAGSRDAGGDLGFFPRGQMVKEFSDAAFALGKPGDVSGVVKSPFGYHLIQLTGSQRGLESFRSTLSSQIAEEKRKEKAAALLTKLRSGARIEFYDEAIRKAEGD